MWMTCDEEGYKYLMFWSRFPDEEMDTIGRGKEVRVCVDVYKCHVLVQISRIKHGHEWQGNRSCALACVFYVYCFGPDLQNPVSSPHLTLPPKRFGLSAVCAVFSTRSAEFCTVDHSCGNDDHLIPVLLLLRMLTSLL